MSFVIQLLGAVQGTWEDTRLKFATEYPRALLAYLTVEADVIHQRTSLATLLWPEENETTARHNLRQTLFLLKQTLARVERRDEILRVTPTTIEWQSHSVVCDLQTFQRLWGASQSHAHADGQLCERCLDHFTQAMTLYQGEFLHGLLIKHSQPFEEWALLWREQCHRQALTMLRTLTAHHLTGGAYDQAQRYAAHLVTLEPWHEEGHRQLMQALAAQGQQGLALRQYESCRRTLQQELNVPPSLETTQLYEQIRAGYFSPVSLAARQTTVVNPPVQPTAQPTPALVAPPKRLHNLPANLAPLVGRTQQVEQLRTLLHTPTERLLTIVGMGGMGKSRLALALLEQLVAESPPPFTHGVWFVPLIDVAANVDNLSNALAGATLKAVGMTTPTVETLQSALFHYLGQRHVLLVFDNVEHLLVEELLAAAVTHFILALLQAAPGATLLLTSRLPLQLLAETVIRLEGLPVPAAGSPATDKRDAANYESVRLFTYHAQRTLPDFTLSNDNLYAVIELCRALSGMPLAIEIAAALTPHFTPSELVAAIRQNLALLVSRRRDLDARHRHFSAVLESSWQSLSAREQEILAQCSIFVGRFSRAAAQAITGATVTELTSLVDKSLIQQPGVGVYQLHDLLRQFANQQLTTLATHSSEALQARYVDYYLGFVADCNVRLRQRGAQTAMTQMRQVSENCRRAWEIALERRWVEPMDASLEGWLRYWKINGAHGEGEVLIAAALAVLEAIATAPSVPEASTARHQPSFLPRFWLAYAHCLYGQERIQASMAAAEKAMALAKANAEESCYAEGLALLATGLALQSRLAEARPWAERAFQSGGWEVQIHALITLASCEQRIEEHVAITAQALQIAQKHEDPYLILMCTQQMAGSYENEGYYAASLPYRDQALQLAYAIQDAYQIGEGHYLYGLIHAHVGLYAIAIEHFEHALLIAQEHNVAWLERRVLNRLARSHYCLGKLDTAYAFSLQVQAVLQQEKLHYPFSEFTYAQILMGMMRWGEAEQILQQVLTHKRTDKAMVAVARLPELAELARLALWQGHSQQALIYVEEILDLVHTHPHISMPNLYFDAFAIDAACYEVLHALADDRAQHVLESSNQRLCAQAEQMADPTVRRSYLENVAANRALRQAYIGSQQPS